ncbi:hypothetical protein [Alloactinosynnema sp. L-07]|uniref:DUF3558 domain-containing protein n=1 Tax=Alloactinosynnema sp. L-07 TaxID=1653480 RepID=UPI00065EFD6C|nr:DUF3558 domain-containing protein [Alloactinosynnema sp. L-07]CRK60399.1 hypothetical protein [Alloactinosynnema sp. L-07]
MKRALLVMAVVALSASACSDETPGEPTAASKTGTTTTTKQNGTSSAPTSPADSPLKAVQPCDLLDESAMGALGIKKPGTAETIGKARSCQWRVEKDSIADSYTFAVALFETLGLSDVKGDGNPTPLTVGSRKAVRTLRGQGAGCAVSIEISAKSRVDVQALGSSGEKLCPAALEAAKLVEPELP